MEREGKSLSDISRALGIRSIGAIRHRFDLVRDPVTKQLPLTCPHELKTVRKVTWTSRGLADCPWPAREPELIALWNKTDPQLSAIEIGNIMHLSKNAIVGKAHRTPECLPRESPIVRDGREHKRKRRPPQIKSTLPALSVETVAIDNVFHPSFVVENPSPPLLSDPAPMTRTCQWIHGTPGGGREYRFCGRACRGSWCSQHYAVVFLKTPVARYA
jgi:hypothetical protein